MTDNIEISANYLFHFTNKLDHIASIIIEGFKPFYCLEKLSYVDVKPKDNEEYFEMAFPIVSFCDLPIHMQKPHRKRFGGYGIALNKDWGIKRNITPVVYTNEYAYTSGVLKNFFLLAQKNNMSREDNHTFGINVSILLMCFKPYEGYQYIKQRNEFDNCISRFYDEKEWRFIPLNCDGLKLNLKRKQYENKLDLAKENLKIQKDNHLIFSLNDLHSIYLTNKTEIEILLQKLSSKYQPSELSIIEDKITIEQ